MRKGQASLTKTGILFVVIVFYSVIFISIGLINIYFNDNIIAEDTNVNNSGFFDMIGNSISGITELPIWLNTIIFTPLIVILGWIIVSSLPTFNGGG